MNTANPCIPLFINFAAASSSSIADVFCNNIVELLKEVKVFKIDDEIIIDQINSCWLVKNELDKYVLA